MRESDARRGWTPWALVVAVVGLLHLISTEIESGHVNVVRVSGFSVAIYVGTRTVLMLIAGLTHFSMGARTFFRASELSYNKPLISFYACVAAAAITVGFSLVNSRVAVVLLIAWFAFQIFTRAILIILERVDLPFPASWGGGEVTGQLTMTIHYGLSTSCLVFFIPSIVSQFGVPTAEDVRIAAMVAGILLVAELLLLTIPRSSLIPRLDDLRRRLFFSDEPVDDIEREAKVLLAATGPTAIFNDEVGRLISLNKRAGEELGIALTKLPTAIDRLKALVKPEGSELPDEEVFRELVRTNNDDSEAVKSVLTSAQGVADANQQVRKDLNRIIRHAYRKLDWMAFFHPRVYGEVSPSFGLIRQEFDHAKSRLAESQGVVDVALAHCREFLAAKDIAVAKGERFAEALTNEKRSLRAETRHLKRQVAYLWCMIIFRRIEGVFLELYCSLLRCVIRLRVRGLRYRRKRGRLPRN